MTVIRDKEHRRLCYKAAQSHITNLREYVAMLGLDDETALLADLKSWSLADIIGEVEDHLLILKEMERLHDEET